ncbi:MAG: hypothetical protein ACOYJQ_09610 [Pseudochelatococcus sp.]|jgi:hypothetical protein|uniref:hypothetical protein n=1 Tax=Pseudochelatococcus sp. TaxID=2020869 RepID=UPI003D8A4E91
MSSDVLLPHPFCHWSGWSGAELAILRDAADTLGSAGFDVDAGWGVSDEGDAWFALCDARTGALILHVARIDKTFTAVSPALDSALYTAELPALIAEALPRLTRMSPAALSSPHP